MSADVLTAITTQTRLKLAKMKEQPWDWALLAIVLSLVGFGVVMLYSASAVMAAQKLGDHLYLVKSQLTKVMLGLVMMFVALRVDYRWYKRFIYPILGVTLVMLVLVLIPGIGAVQNGARRWFSIAGMSFQPAEVVKIVVVMYLAYSVSKKGDKMGRFSVGFVPHLMVVGTCVGFLMMQPDFGSSVILITMMGVMLFVSGARIAYLMIFAVLGGFGAFFAITRSAYRMKRIMAFLDPWSYRTDIGYQISESLIAIGSGGVGGRGLGNGAGKLGYVPELWNDFIGTIVAEELGLMGIIVLVAMFLALIWRGLKIAYESNDEFGRYLAFGITILFGLQGGANLCVVTGLLPTKGLTLPFVSFGGSSMIMALCATGILLNISRNAPDEWESARPEREKRHEERRWQRKRKSILRKRKDLRDVYR